MITGKLKPRVTRLGRFARRWRFDRNPLRRATDRAETAVLTVLVTAFLIGVPFVALAMGAWVQGMAQRAQLAQEASRSQVTAVVLVVTPPPAGDGEVLAWQVQARWKAPDGQVVTQQMPVSAGTAVGGKLQVWTDRTGDLSTAPLLDSQVADQTALGEALGAIASVAVLTLAGSAGPLETQQAPDGRLGRGLAGDRSALDEPHLRMPAALLVTKVRPGRDIRPWRPGRRGGRLRRVREKGDEDGCLVLKPTSTGCCATWVRHITTPCKAGLPRPTCPGPWIQWRST